MGKLEGVDEDSTEAVKAEEMDTGGGLAKVAGGAMVAGAVAASAPVGCSCIVVVAVVAVVR